MPLATFLQPKMLTAILFSASTLAHLHMIQPLPIFTNGPGNQNAPIASCSVIPYTPDTPAAVLASFKTGLSRFQDLRAYFDSCGARKCGHTVATHIVPLPVENVVRLNVGARHVGPVEIWIDDTRVVQSDQLLDSYPVDFSVCRGQCTVRLIMAALHVFPAEIYDNCVIVNAGGNAGGVTLPSRQQQRPTPQPSTAPVPPSAPIPVPQPPTDPTSQPPVDSSPSPPPTTTKPTRGQKSVGNGDIVREFSCSADATKLIRKVGSATFEFSCPPGTTCKPVEGIEYPVCQ
jgi:hypothetical protein